jgi:hypothetical protein
MEKENIIWTVPEVAKYLGCNVSSIRKLVRNGQIFEYAKNDNMKNIEILTDES